MEERISSIEEALLSMDKIMQITRKDLLWSVVGLLCAILAVCGGMYWDIRISLVEIAQRTAILETDMRHVKAQLNANGYVLGKWKKGDVLVPVFPTKGGDAPLFKVVPAGKAVEQLKWPQ